MLRSILCVLICVTSLALFGPQSAIGHESSFPIEGKKASLKRGKFFFEAKNQSAIRVSHDPTVHGTSVFVQGLRKNKSGSSGLIRLDPAKWEPLLDEDAALKGYRYKDAEGTRGGVTRIIWKSGTIKLKALGKNWDYAPKGKLKSLWLHFRMEDELYCAEFAGKRGSKVSINKKGAFKAKGGSLPGECPSQVCGNGVVELGEFCDDGNLSETDGCNNDCTLGACTDEEFDSTYAAIQSVIFESDVYQCTNEACHGSAVEGGLDLRVEASFESLVGADSEFGGQKRVLANEPNLSLLYNKLAKKTLGAPEDVGTAMPVSGPPLSDQHLAAMYEWIRGGASPTASVLGTSTLLSSCLPAPDPLVVDKPDPPAPGTGVQLVMEPRALPARSESETCMSTYFDFTGLVPESAVVECPEGLQQSGFCSNDADAACVEDSDCGDEATCYIRNNLNTGNKCFAYDRLNLTQDAQSHHTVGFVYNGVFDTADPGWGPWTYKFRDTTDPRQDTACDPLAVDPSIGVNPNCGGEPIDSALCISYGPPDYSDPTNLIGGDQLFFTTEAYLDVAFADTVYNVFPMRGVLAWNSHAFNLTGFDSTMAGYMQLDFAAEEDQINRVRLLADIDSIFTQRVPPFETRQYCDSGTVVQGTKLFRLFSHTHRTGVLFEAWAPPNEPCRADCTGSFCFFQDSSLPICEGPREDDPIYRTTSYSDPLQLFFDPPMTFDSDDPADRTWLYCAVYDNGSTPTSPRLKRVSTSPPSPGGPSLGGPCDFRTVACANEGPMKGELCNNDDSVCDSEPGAGDGDCDACPVIGGLTSEDEMLILFGDYYCDGPCGDEVSAEEP